MKPILIMKMLSVGFSHVSTQAMIQWLGYYLIIPGEKCLISRVIARRRMQEGIFRPRYFSFCSAGVLDAPGEMHPPLKPFNELKKLKGSLILATL